MALARAAAAVLLLSTAWSISSPAQEVTTVANFNSVWSTIGGGPIGPMVLGGNGSFYGLTSMGADSSGALYGAAFKVAPNGGLTLLHQFCTQGPCTDGYQPEGPLVAATNGNFYGVTFGGGANNAGVVFQLTSAGAESVIYTFCPQTDSNNYCIDGDGAVGGLVQGKDGSLYGTTSAGGTYNGGTLFKVSTGGGLTTLVNFCGACATGGGPSATLTVGSDGSLYGSTTIGGAYGNASYGGTIFKYSPGANSVTTIHSFCQGGSLCPDGLTPGTMFQATNGLLYGTTYSGGAHNDGSIFSISTTGTFNSIYSFCSTSACKDGAHPQGGLIQTSDGAIYGTAGFGGLGGGHSGGVVFKLSGGTTYGVVYNFCATSDYNGSYCVDGAGPDGLVLSSNGQIFGSTLRGGGTNGSDNEGAGMVFTLGLVSHGAALSAQADYFGEGKSGFNVFRPSTGYWYSRDESGKTLSEQWGISTDTPVLGDYDGDGKSDVAVFRSSNGTWYISDSGTGTTVSKQFGASTDTPVCGDFDGDGKSDIAVFRPANGYWYITQSSDSEVVSRQWGEDGDTPVTGDFDGDGKTDIAVFRPSNGYWYISQSSNGTVVSKQWGESGDIPATGDFDGDGKTDIAVYRPSTGYWYIVQSSNGQVVARQWGESGDIPVARDYDGDGKTDIAVYRPSTGNWYVISSSSGVVITQQWGVSTDISVNGLAR